MRVSQGRSSMYATLSVLALAATSSAFAQPKPRRTDAGAQVRSVLWVGNSFFYYNNSMHNHVSNLARAADPKSAFCSRQ